MSHLVEQLWAPALATENARVVIGSRQSEGWTTAEEYLVLPGLASASMLIPARPSRVTARSLLNYRGLRRRAPNAQRAVLGAAVRSGAPLPFPRLRLEVRDLDGQRPLLPLSMLADDLHRGEVYASIGIRTGANRKATLQLVDDLGEPLGFAKVAWNGSSAEGVRREGVALSDPLVSGPARTPVLLAEGTYYGQPYIVTSPLPLTAKGVRSNVPPPSPEEFHAVSPLVRRGRLATSEQFRALADRVVSRTGDSRTLAVLDATRDLMHTLQALDVDMPVTSRWHGDLTPWNSARDVDGTFWCWDWESSETGALAGLDAVHWHVTVATETGRRLGAEVLAEATRLARPTFVAAGAPRGGWAHIAGVYVAILADRACELAAGPGGWEEEWVMPEQLLELIERTRSGLVSGS